jgi:hypothetical protein
MDLMDGVDTIISHLWDYAFGKQEPKVRNAAAQQRSPTTNIHLAHWAAQKRHSSIVCKRHNSTHLRFERGFLFRQSHGGQVRLRQGFVTFFKFGLRKILSTYSQVYSPTYSQFNIA